VTGCGSVRLGRHKFGMNLCLQVWNLMRSYVRGGYYAGLVSLTSSPCSSGLLFSAGDWSASRVLLCVRVRRLGAFGVQWERENKCVKNVEMGKPMRCVPLFICI